MAKKKYYKVVILQTELVTVARKKVFVNVEKVVESNVGLHIYRDGEIVQVFPLMSSEYFIKQQKRKIDDGNEPTQNIRKSRTKKKNKVA